MSNSEKVMKVFRDLKNTTDIESFENLVPPSSVESISLDLAEILQDDDCPEILEVIKAEMSRPEIKRRHFGLYCLSTLMVNPAPYVQKHLPDLLSKFSLMADKTVPIHERLVIFSASARLFGTLAEEGDLKKIKRMKSIAMNMLTLLQDVYSGRYPTLSPADFKMVSSVAESWLSVPGFCDAHLKDFLECLLDYCSQESLDMELLTFAIDPFRSLISTQPQKFSKLKVTARKSEGSKGSSTDRVSFLKRMVDFFVHSATFVGYEDDIDSWNLVSLGDEVLYRADVLEQFFDEFCGWFAGQDIVVELTNTLPVYINDISNWKNRVGGLMSISTCVEQLKSEMVPYAEQLIALILPRLSDEHPRVQYAAGAAIAQMCSDWMPLLQTDYASIFHDKMLSFYHASEHLRLQDLAMEYTKSFFGVEPIEGLSYDIVSSCIPYLPTILSFLNPPTQRHHSILSKLEADIEAGLKPGRDADGILWTDLATRTFTEFRCSAWLNLMFMADKFTNNEFDETFQAAWTEAESILSKPLDLTSYERVKLYTATLDAITSMVSDLGEGNDQLTFAKRIASYLNDLIMPPFATDRIVDGAVLRPIICSAYKTLAVILGDTILEFAPNFFVTVMSLADMNPQDFSSFRDEQEEGYDDANDPNFDANDPNLEVIRAGSVSIAVNTARFEEMCHAMRILGHLIMIVPEVAISHIGTLPNLLDSALQNPFKRQMVTSTTFAYVMLFRAFHRKCVDDEAMEPASLLLTNVLSQLLQVLTELTTQDDIEDAGFEIIDAIFEIIGDVTTLDNHQTQLLTDMVAQLTEIANNTCLRIEAETAEEDDDTTPAEAEERAEKLNLLEELFGVLREINSYALEHQAL